MMWPTLWSMFYSRLHPTFITRGGKHTKEVTADRDEGKKKKSLLPSTREDLLSTDAFLLKEMILLIVFYIIAVFKRRKRWSVIQYFSFTDVPDLDVEEKRFSFQKQQDEQKNNPWISAYVQRLETDVFPVTWRVLSTFPQRKPNKHDPEHETSATTETPKPAEEAFSRITYIEETKTELKERILVQKNSITDKKTVTFSFLKHLTVL